MGRMKLSVVLVAALLVVAGAIAARFKGAEKKGETLSLEVESQAVSPTPSQIPTATSSPSPTNIPTSSPSFSDGIFAFIYPGARVIASTDSSATLESSEDPDKITDWYKGKIKGLGMNVKSFVVTSSNDKVLNKLSAANGKQEINVEISRENLKSSVKISVKIRNL